MYLIPNVDQVRINRILDAISRHRPISKFKYILKPVLIYQQIRQFSVATHLYVQL